VSVPVAKWVARRLFEPGDYDDSGDLEMGAVDTWPPAAWGAKGRRYAADVSAWPVRMPYRALKSFLRYDTVSLSLRAAKGFYARALESTLSFEDGFLEDVAHHIDRMRHQTHTAAERDLAA